MTEDILSGIMKPGRYIGGEWNASKKDFHASNIKFALCFPDLYEIGMSNLGIRILYGILNGISDVSCERFFSPAKDMEESLRNNKMEIFSLESKKPLKDFDLAGFSLGHELGYTNVLNILDLGGIPLRASERPVGFPLIIGGGPCTLNPEPMHEFFDFFVIGEAEDAIKEIINLYRELKDKFKAFKISKQELLILFSRIEGVYVPSLYEPKYAQNGKIVEFKPRFETVPAKVKKRTVQDFDNAYFPGHWIVPYIEIVHDRITLEIMRGCSNACRFCQARYFYFPFRQKNPGRILNLASEIYKKTGYDEIALTGLSVSDYSALGELLESLIRLFKQETVSISLPSIKPKMMVGNLASLIATIKKTGLTFAPEAATERLRKILNKDFDIENFFKALEQVYLSGYQHIKLYFMIGLPDEQEADLDGILEFAADVSELKRQVTSAAACSNALNAFPARKSGPAEVNISINTLIPKPHTPFQRLGMEQIDAVKAKIAYLRNKKRSKKLKLTFHNPYMSFLEGVLSRGDRRLSQVIESAFNKGARFDAWDDHFVFQRWQDSFVEFNIAPEFYLREKSKDEFLPWDFLDL